MLADRNARLHRDPCSPGAMLHSAAQAYCIQVCTSLSTVAVEPARSSHACLLTAMLARTETSAFQGPCCTRLCSSALLGVSLPESRLLSALNVQDKREGP